uniref:Ankyrin repeat protein n=1 Tax=Pithovirus LCPAC403 TaxID=2506596 RepID=A0A481ZB49_9VIRU|nr:MAG: uncharacterized protein LCPAC403_02880 [Pithovirus LCPAC403]
MECGCNALEVMKKNGGKHVDELFELYNNSTPGSFIKCTGCSKKPDPVWIWESLAKEALLKGLANTDVLKFIESKRMYEYYGSNFLKTSAAAGHLDSIQYIVDYGLDPTAHQDCSWDYFENYGSLVINMWKAVLKKAIDAGHDSGELFEYLELMVKISKVNADIDFIGGKIYVIPKNSGVPELKTVLNEISVSISDIIRKKREKHDRKTLHLALKDGDEDYYTEESKSDE